MILSLRSKPLGIDDHGKSALLLRRSSPPRESGSYPTTQKTRCGEPRARCYIDEPDVET